jgi:hypothetical protein
MSTQAIGNTGIPSGAKVGKAVVKGFLVQTFATDGTRNELDGTGGSFTLTKVALDALLNHADPSKRIYPLPKFYDAELPKADNVLDTASDGTNFFIQEGIRSFSAMHKAQDATILKSLDSFECDSAADWSIYLVDTCENVFVEEVDANKGRPLQISQDTFAGVYNFATNSTTNNVTITYDFDKLIKDSRLKLVKVDEDADILRAKGLVTVRVAYSAISTTGATAVMTFDYGFLGDNQPYEAALTTDFELNEITPTPGAVAGFTVTEGVPGTYALAWTLEATNDVLELTSSAAGLAKKFEVEANSRFTIP